MVLRTERLSLRDFEEDDLAAFAKLVSDPCTGKRMGSLPWRIHEGSLIGDAGLQYLEGGPEVELLYRLSREFWGRALAFEATRAVLSFAFSVPLVDEVAAVIADDNPRSQRLAHRLGFRRGTLGMYYGQSLRKYLLTAREFEW